MPSYVFDIETNGLKDFRHLTDLHEIHCIVGQDIETGEVYRANSKDGGLQEAVSSLQYADLIVGQNIIRFDIPAIQKLYPSFAPRGIIRDTQVCTKLIWPKDVLVPIDYALATKGKFPRHLIGRYSLEAWGHRIGDYKGAKQDFSKWSQELEDYCVRDVAVTTTLWKRIVAQKYSEQAIQLEHDVAQICFDQERAGVYFDSDAAQKLYASLVQRRLELDAECSKLFEPWELRTPFTPKVNSKKLGYVKGVPTEKIKKITFNPGSHDHIADRFIKMRGWKPTVFTPSGDPKLDEGILKALPYPEVKPLLKRLLVQKRIGQLAEGDEALMKRVNADGRIHGEVNTNEAVTGRASHSHPNLAQVPKVKLDKDGAILYGEAGLWGWEFRSLFVAPKGWKMVGADASGLELRMLGHYMAKWDGGAYAKQVVEGDPHTLAMNAGGLPSRDKGKTTMYALIYGAGDGKLGKIVGRGMKAGRLIRSKLMANLPALGRLVNLCKLRHRTVKYLKGLDGRLLHTRSEHSALNTLLQSAGALVCKLWMVLLHRALKARGFTSGKDYVQVLWVHDEIQLYSRPEIADEIGCIAVECVREAGATFGLRVPLGGEFKVGRTWAETH